MPPGRSARGACAGPAPGSPTRRSIAAGDLRQRASGREARAPRSEQGASSRTRSKPAAIPISPASASITVTLRSPRRSRLGRDFGGPRRVELDRDHLAAVLHPRRDLAGLDPRPGAEVEHVLARAGGRAPRPRRPSRGSAGSARPAATRLRRRQSPVRPSTTILLGRGQRPRRPAAGARLDAGSRASAGEHRLALERRARRRSATSAGSLQAASRARAPSGPSSSHHIRASQSGAEWATAAASGVESSPSSACVSSLALARRPAQDRVDEARRRGRRRRP